MNGEFVPSDQAYRLRIETELDATFFVEAGAGTGKTRELVCRITNLIAGGAAEIDRIAAITFTEAAAAELRDRVRTELEKHAADRAPAEEKRTRCHAALSHFDDASIQTLHSFAASLLRERPFEAGLPLTSRSLPRWRQVLNSSRAGRPGWTEPWRGKRSPPSCLPP